MDEERLQILKMLEGGKISADEASRLLEAMEAGRPAPAPEASVGRVKWLRVKVTEGQKSVVNVRVPASLLGVASRFLPKDLKDQDGHSIDLVALAQAVKAGANGTLVEVDDGDDHVEITVE